MAGTQQALTWMNYSKPAIYINNSLDGSTDFLCIQKSNLPYKTIDDYVVRALKRCRRLSERQMALLLGFGWDDIRNKQRSGNTDQDTTEEPDATLDRHNYPDPGMIGSVRYQGFPDGGMVHAKQPVRVPPSADVQDVTRFFRKDSPTQFRAEHQPPPSPMKQGQEQPSWLQNGRGTGRSPPPPQEQQMSQVQQTVSPHYDTRTPPRQSNSPNIPNIRGEMSSAEMKKKREEAEVARENYNEDLRRKEMVNVEKREEQRRIRHMQENYKPFGHPGGGAPIMKAMLDIDFHPYGKPGGGAPNAAGTLNRKMKFTEHQMEKPGSPSYNRPTYFGEPYDTLETAFPEYDRRSPAESYQYGEDRGRSPMKERPDSYNMDYGTRREDELRKQETAISDLRRKIRELEKENTRRGGDTNRGQYTNRTSEGLQSFDKNALTRMLEQQEKDIGRIQSEINQLKDQRAQESYRGPEKPDPYYGYGAYTDRPQDYGHPPPYGQRSRSDNYPDYGYGEPLTDRPYQQGGYMPDFDATPRRRPPGQQMIPGDLFNTNTTYMNDFDLPYGRSRRNLGNPNQEGPANVAWPFNKPGGGAPMANQIGQRCTRIQGTMNVIGAEHSHSARARRARNSDMLETLKRQKEEEKAKKLMEKERMRQPYLEMAADMRGGKKVGYPRYLPNGQIAQHHLMGAMSNPNGPADFNKQNEYRHSLDEQTAQKQRDTALAQLEASQQAKKHHYVFDSKFGRMGGGNRKGQDVRKVNLDRAIHRFEETGSIHGQYYSKVRVDDMDSEVVLDKFKPKVTVNSTHKNLYEFPNEGSIKTAYQGGAPYASHAGF